MAININRKAISSLAMVNTLALVFRKDYIEIFIPFLATLIKNKGYSEITIVQVAKDFEEEFGLRIPYQPLVTILNRAAKQGIIKKESGRYLPVNVEVLKCHFSDVSERQQRKQNQILDAFMGFCKTKYPEEPMDKARAEEALLGYIKKYDLEIIFASQNKSVLSDIKPPKQNLFLISKFIQEIAVSSTDLFDFLIEITTGFILASTITYDIDFKKFEGKLRKINFYLDTKLIFRLLGVEDIERKQACIDLLNILRKQGANLFLFQHTYAELLHLLEIAKKWVQKTDDDPTKESLVLRYFRSEGYNIQDVQRFIDVELDKALRSFSIKVIDAPEFNEMIEYNVNETKLREIILHNYNLPEYLDLGKDATIQKDIDSITAINKFRKGFKPRNIKQATDIFITTNVALAFASREYEFSEFKGYFFVPACLTDIFVGTIIWLDSPLELRNLNRQKLISDSYAALRPDSMFLKKLSDESKKLLSKGLITDDEFYLLRSSPIVQEMIVEKTLGEVENFKPQTPLEVLEEIKKEGRQEFEEKYIKSKREKEEVLKKLDAQLKFRSKIERIVERVIGATTWVIFIGIFFVLFFLTSFLPPLVTLKNKYIYFSEFINLIYLFFSVGLGWSLKRIRRGLNIKLKVVLLKVLEPKH